jgi:NTE family protein
MEDSKDFALALSGGGFRASLFALGCLWRLNEFGLLYKMDRITSVSGGSITSAWLAQNWTKLNFDKTTGVSPGFKEVIADPLQEFCSKGIDALALLSGIILPWTTIGDRVAWFYARRLYKKTTLQDIPSIGEGPEFIFYATSLQTGSSVRIAKASIDDFKIGTWPTPEITLAKAVGISSAFPPILSPVKVKSDPARWIKTKGAYLYNQIRYREKLALTDGGVYDNLGLEAVWDNKFHTITVCDASAPFKPNKSPWANWFSQAMRVTDIITYQTRALRRRKLIEDYEHFNETEEGYGGVYMGINTKIDNYELDDAMVKDNTTTKKVQDVPTRLAAFSKKIQGHCINWGYALTDAALRKYYFKTPQKPGTWPIPEFALDKDLDKKN